MLRPAFLSFAVCAPCPCRPPRRRRPRRWLQPLPVQEPSQQEPPRFRAGVEITSLDVTVVDDRGKPIAGLAPNEFTVRIDGNPRKVVSSEWIPHHRRRSAGRPPPPPDGYSTNENSTGGRLIVLTIDEPNIRFGGALAITKAANWVRRPSHAIRPGGGCRNRRGRPVDAVHRRSPAHQAGDQPDGRAKTRQRIDHRSRPQHRPLRGLAGRPRAIPGFSSRSWSASARVFPARR